MQDSPGSPPVISHPTRVSVMFRTPVLSLWWHRASSGRLAHRICWVFSAREGRMKINRQLRRQRVTQMKVQLNIQYVLLLFFSKITSVTFQKRTFWDLPQSNDDFSWNRYVTKPDLKSPDGLIPAKLGRRNWTCKMASSESWTRRLSSTSKHCSSNKIASLLTPQQ